MLSKIIQGVDGFIFSNRKLVLVVFSIITVLMAASATQLEVKAGFEKLLPLKHCLLYTSDAADE